MNLRRILAGILFVGLLGGVGFYIFRGSADPSIKGPIRVVSAENFYGNIAQQLGGEHVRVQSIIKDPQDDPHGYEATALNASAVGTADMVIRNGLGYDDFMDKLLQISTSKKRVILTVADSLGATNPDVNPHLWYNLPRMQALFKDISDSYIAIDPKHAADYHAALQTFQDSLRPLLLTRDTIAEKYKNTAVAYTEPVPEYLINFCDLDNKTPVGFAKSIADGTDPSPADTAAFESLLRNKSISVLFYNSQTTGPVSERIKAVAQESGVPVIGITESMPADQTSYQSWQLSQLQALLKTLQGVAS